MLRCAGQRPSVTTEVHGEGIFIRFDEVAIAAWETEPAVVARRNKLQAGHRGWRNARKLDPDDGFPGIRYAMLHTLSHLLIREELALECGYNAASIRERIYADTEGDELQAGILIYTAAADSDGTLGGLVELGKPENLRRLLRQALGRAGICSSDPLCSTIRRTTGPYTRRPVMPAPSYPRRHAKRATAISTAPSSCRPLRSPTRPSSIEEGMERLIEAVIELVANTPPEKAAQLASAVHELSSPKDSDTLSDWATNPNARARLGKLSRANYRKCERRNRSETRSRFAVLGNYDRVEAALGHVIESKSELAGTLRPDDFDYQT